ncbi:MAG: Hint domain-containing protein [Paenirhodobacter sp.]|uniref:Hint domain-containing protein n=1 Tax=Paenirhodobacter sp. TaxID=1965326 RepID=UPI003D0BAA0F
MTLTIYALDNEFAVATGSNVNSGPGTSTFDYPPNSTKDLVITSQPGDDSPYIFSPGDTYTVSFGGNGGTTIENAVVLRSDPVSINGDTGYAVVFEGLDPNGDVVQVVWSPEFDLETWYWDNYSGGAPPGFYTSDASPSDYTVPCFTPEARIATPEGARAAGDLRAGDLVLTRDHGAQGLRWVARATVSGQGRGAPVWFETGTIGNSAPLRLSQQHRLLVSLPPDLAAEEGAAELLLPARAFVNGATVQLRPEPRITYCHLLLDRHEVLAAEGAPCESLFLGPVASAVMRRMGAPLLARAPIRLPMRPARPLRRMAEAVRLLERLRESTGLRPVLLGRRGKRGSGTYVFAPDASGRHPASRRIVVTEETHPAGGRREPV